MTLGGLGSLTKPFLWVAVWIHQGQLQRTWRQVQVNFETCTFNSHSFGFNSAKPINHTLYSTAQPPPPSTSPAFQLQWQVALGGLGEHDSTAAQKSPTGVLLTGCPLSSVPISPWPSPHLGRCSERSTGGGREDTLPYLKLLCNKIFFKFYVLGCVVSDFKKKNKT